MKYTPESLLEQHSSHPRNKNVAFAFYKAGFIESWGRGYKKIHDGFESAGLPMPKIDASEGGVLVTFRRNNVNSNLNESVRGNVLKGQKTSQKTSQKIVEHIRNNNDISTQEMANIIGIDRRNIARQIKNLQAKGIIRRVGPDKGGHWEVIDNGEK